MSGTIPTGGTADRRKVVDLLSILVLAIALTTLAACDGDGDASQQAGTSTGPPTVEAGMPDQETDVTTPAAEPDSGGATEIEAAAREFLAAELRDGDPVLISSEGVAWSDASLGCPQEGEFYAQVITPGHKLVFESAGQRYTVHANADGSHMVICENGRR